MTTILDRFYAYADEHKLRVSTTRAPGGSWLAWVSENYGIEGRGNTHDAALTDLARDVASRGLYRAQVLTELPTAGERLPPFLMEAEHA